MFGVWHILNIAVQEALKVLKAAVSQAGAFMSFIAVLCAPCHYTAAFSHMTSHRP